MSALPQGDRWVVLKFGGTSVSRRHRWDTIGKLAKKRADESGGRILVVVSALSGVTNELLAISEGASDSAQRVAALVGRHRDFCIELGLDPERVLGERLALLEGLLEDPRAPARSLDWQAEVLAQGELLSSTLGAAYLAGPRGLDFGWMDARDWLVSAPAGENQSAWSRRLSVNCRWQAEGDFKARFDAQPQRMLITQGFIAAHAEGGTAILGEKPWSAPACCCLPLPPVPRPPDEGGLSRRAGGSRGRRGPRPAARRRPTARSQRSPRSTPPRWWRGFRWTARPQPCPRLPT